MESIKELMSIGFRDDWWILILPVACIVIDVITGVLNAWIEHNIKSYLLRKGLGKKGGEILTLILGELLVCGLAVPKELLGGVSIYIVFMEVISICENLDKLGVPIPVFIKNALATANKIILSTDSKTETLSEDVQKQLKELIEEQKGGKTNE